MSSNHTERTRNRKLRKFYISMDVHAILKWTLYTFFDKRAKGKETCFALHFYAVPCIFIFPFQSSVDNIYREFVFLFCPGFIVDFIAHFILMRVECTEDYFKFKFP